MQEVRLLKTADPEALSRLVEDRSLRAAAYFPFGCYRGITFTHEVSVRTYSTLSGDCVLPDCVGGVHIGSFLSHEVQQDVVGFAVLEPVLGAFSEALRHVESVADGRPDDVTTVYSPVLGNCDPLVIVEVLGPDEDSVHLHLQQIIDSGTLRHACTLLTFGDLTWGFGQPADPASAPDGAAETPAS